MAPEIRLSAVTRRRAATNSPRPEELSVFVREARLRFMEAFEAHCGTLAPADHQAPPPSLDEAGRVLHRIAGIGGGLGFPLVSAKAAEIEERLFDGNRRRA